MKKILIGILGVLALVGCGGGGSSSTKEVEQIDFGSLSDTIAYFKTLEYGKASDSLYSFAKDYLTNQYDNMDILKTEYDIQMSGIRNIYSKSLNEAAQNILISENCRKGHKELKKINKLITQMLKYEGLNKEVVEQLKKNRDNINLHFKIVYRAYATEQQSSPYNLQSSYDTSYAKNRIAIIQKLVAMYPYKCSTVKGALVVTKKRLNSRHQDFLYKLVDSLLLEEFYDYNTYGSVSKEIDRYYYSGDGRKDWALKYGVSKGVAKSFVEDLIYKIETFKDEKNKIEENESTDY